MNNFYLPTEVFTTLGSSQKAAILSGLLDASVVTDAAGELYSKFLQLLDSDEFERECDRVLDSAERCAEGGQS